MVQFPNLAMAVTWVGAVVDAVGEQVAQPGEQLVDCLNKQNRTVAILASAAESGMMSPTNPI
jgi:hypothetical protein